MQFTDRMSYQPLEVEHAAALFAALDDPRVWEHLGGPEVSSVGEQRERIHFLHQGPTDRTTTWHNCVMIRRVDGAIIGRLEATSYGSWAEVAYVIAPAVWGNGYATEGLRWWLDHLEHDVGINEFWAAVLPTNARSIALLERIGFRSSPTPPARPLGSFDDGDLVFTLQRSTSD